MKIIPKSNWLVKDDQKIIREKSVDVKIPLSEKSKDIMEKMILFVNYSQDDIKNKNRELMPAIGLAAPQIGNNLNMYYIKINKEHNDNKKIEHALINPKIIGFSKQNVALENGEGCLSVRNQKEGYVVRSYKVIVEGYDYLKKENVRIEAKKYEAIVIQHEQDHLNGKLYYDHINKNDPWAENDETIYL